MKKNDPLHRWYNRPVTPCLFFIAMTLLSAASLFKTELGGSMPSAEKNFSIITQHYGISSEEIERTITAPLEESISVITGIERLRSSSEYSKSRVDIILRKETDSTEFYLNLRDRIERVYSSMPQSVQKPQIVTSGSNQKPSFIISFSSDVTDPVHLRPFIENEVKPSYEKIPGIREIEVGGGALKEIHIELNEEKLTLAGHNPGTIASMIQKQNQYSPLGKIKQSSIHIPVSIDGRLSELNEIKKLMITTRSGQGMELQELAVIRFGYRKPESVSRVGGGEKVTLYIKTGGESNIVELSERLNKVSEHWINKGLDVKVIYDQGLQMDKSIRQVMAAIAIGMIAVALFVAITVRNLKQAFVLSLTLPITGMVSIAILNFLNISVDNYILAGMAIAVGIIIDSGIIISESITENKRDIGKILPALISSTITSAIVLLPLIYLRDSITGIGPISITLLIMLLLSLLLNVLFIPVFLNGSPRVQNQPPFIRKMKNALLRASKFAYEKWAAVILSALILFAAAIFSLISGGSKFDAILEEPLVFAHVEMESGASVSSVDERIRNFIPILEEHPQINQVESISRRGNA